MVEAISQLEGAQQLIHNIITANLVARCKSQHAGQVFDELCFSFVCAAF